MTQPKALSTKVKPSVPPKRRFPEFHSGQGWETRTLGTLASINSEKVGDAECVPMSITSGVGLVSQQEKFGRIIAGNSYRNYLLLRKNDFAYNRSATKQYPEGFIALYTGDAPAAVPNSIFTSFRLKDDSTLPEYLNFLFLGNLHGRWLRRFIEVGARAHGSLSVSDKDLLALPVPLPHGPSSRAEQGRITECLSRLDELIDAESKKLYTLMAHKKGLLQQLFPREGEARPRLRFSEFQDDSAWVRKPLSKLAENLDSKRAPITAKDRQSGSIPYYGASGIVDRVRDHLFEGDLLCVSEDGANLVARTYPIAFSISGKTWVNNHAHVLRFEKLFTQKLVEDYLNLVDLKDFLSGMAQPKLNKTMLDSIPIPLPHQGEQQRISSFLSSVDDLIAAQDDRLRSLKRHKQGLMQELFPALGGVGA